MNDEQSKNRKAVLKLERELIEFKHKCKMEELAYERENARIFHENEKERIRIKSAEIKRTQERREWRNFGEQHAHK